MTRESPGERRSAIETSLRCGELAGDRGEDLLEHRIDDGEPRLRPVVAARLARLFQLLQRVDGPGRQEMAERAFQQMGRPRRGRTVSSRDRRGEPLELFGPASEEEPEQF